MGSIICVTRVQRRFQSPRAASLRFFATFCGKTPPGISPGLCNSPRDLIAAALAARDNPASLISRQSVTPESIVMRWFTRCLLATLLLAAIAPAVRAQMSPTPEHSHLESEVGVWDAEVQMWYTPDAEPVASKAVETNKMLGKLWLLSTFEGDFGGMKFTGHMQLGYDPTKKKYVGTWIDTMSPYLQTMEGTWDDKTNTSTMLATGVDLSTGKPSTSKMVTRYESDDVKIFQMLMPVEGKEGEWWKMMEVKYTRKK